MANNCLSTTLQGHHEIVYDMEWGNVLLDENESGACRGSNGSVSPCAAASGAGGWQQARPVV